MSFDETIIWENPNAAYGELSKISHKPDRVAGSKSLRSITSWVWENKTTYLTRHLYLSNHGEQENEVQVPRFEYYENRKQRTIGRTTYLETRKDELDPVAAATLLAYGNQGLARLVTEALAEVIPTAMLKYVPTEGTSGAQRLIAARFPLLRHLAETQEIVMPEQVPARFIALLKQRTAHGAVSRLVGRDGASRPAAAELGRILVVDGRVRTREVSMLLAARGLPRDTIAGIIGAVEPVGDGTVVVEPEVGIAVSEALSQLGHEHHRQVVSDLLARADGHEQLEAIVQAHARRELPAAGGRIVDRVVERARRRGPFDELDRLAVPGTDSHLQVLYPGDDAELTVLGTQMRNCIRHYVVGGAMTFDTGAIIAVVDHTGRATHAIEVDDRRTVINWQGRGGTPPPADRPQVEQVLRDHRITVSGRHERGFGDDAPF